jgi:Flp pilus assembly protein CpaB
MNTPITSQQRIRRLWRRLVWHRRKIAAVLAVGAAFAALNLVKPLPAPSVTLVTANHDLAAGARLRASDLAEVVYPKALAPTQALGAREQALGRMVTSGLARGTPLTALNLSGAAWSHLPLGHTAVPARLQDSAVADLLKPGQHVRLAAVDPRSPTEAQTLVDDAVVLAAPPADRGTTAAPAGRLVVFDVPASRANLVTSSAVSRYLTVIWGY